MILRTPRLSLRPLEPADEAPVVAMLNDWEVAQWLSVPPYPYTPDDFRQFMTLICHAHATPCPTTFAVALRPGNSLIGVVGIAPENDGAATLGYWYGRAYWGQGYATEAARAVVAHAGSCSTVDRLTASTDPENEASHRVLLKTGFVVAALRERTAPTRRGAKAMRVYHYVAGSPDAG